MIDRKELKYGLHLILVLVLAFIVACSGMDEQETMAKAKAYLEESNLAASAIELKNVLRSNTNNSEARYMLGKISLQMGDATTAEKEFRRVMQTGWEEASVHLSLAEVLFRKGEFQSVLDDIPIKDSFPDSIKANLLGLWAYSEIALGKDSDAEETIITAEKLDKDALWVLQSKVRLILKKGDEPKADKVLAAALLSHPDSQDLWLLKAGRSKDKDDLVSAENDLQKVIDLEPPKIVSAWGRQAYLAQTRLRLLQSDVEKATLSLTPVLKQYPSDPEANYLGGLIAFIQKDYALTEERLLKVFKVQPEHYPSLLLFGNLKYTQKDYQQAAYNLEKATASQPGNLDAQKLLSRTYMILGQYNEAENRLEYAAAKTGDDSELLALAGVTKLKSGDMISGIQKLEQAAAIDPGNAGIRGELMKAYVITGDTKHAIEVLESVMEKDGRTSDDDAMLVIAYLRGGELNKALDLANKLTAQFPESPLAHHLTGIAHGGLKDYEAARNSYGKALAINPDYILSMMAKAGLDIHAGDIESARSQYQSVLKIQPDHVSAMVSLANLYAIEGKDRQTIELLEKARKADEKALDPRLILANIYLLKNNAEKALEYANEARTLNADSFQVLLTLGRAQLINGKQEATETLGLLVKRFPESADAHFYNSKAQAIDGNTAASRESLKRVLALRPDYTLAKYALGKLELSNGKHDTALKLAHDLKNTDSEFAGGCILEGDVHMSRGNTDAALTAYLSCLNFAKSSELVLRINNAYRANADAQAGYKTLHDWLKRYPDDHLVRVNLATSHMIDNQNDAAITEYEKVYESLPENATILNDLAWLYQLKGKPEALEMARKAHRLERDNPAIADTYGWLLVQTGRAESGLVILQEAASKLSENLDVQYHLAVALDETGQKDKARQLASLILKKDEPFYSRKDAEALLEKLR